MGREVSGMESGLSSNSSVHIMHLLRSFIFECGCNVDGMLVAVPKLKDLIFAATIGRPPVT